jgi:hypothetical protein
MLKNRHEKPTHRESNLSMQYADYSILDIGGSERRPPNDQPVCGLVDERRSAGIPDYDQQRTGKACESMRLTLSRAAESHFLQQIEPFKTTEDALWS